MNPIIDLVTTANLQTRLYTRSSKNENKGPNYKHFVSVYVRWRRLAVFVETSNVTGQPHRDEATNGSSEQA